MESWSNPYNTCQVCPPQPHPIYTEKNPQYVPPHELVFVTLESNQNSLTSPAPLLKCYNYLTWNQIPWLFPDLEEIFFPDISLTTGNPVIWTNCNQQCNQEHCYTYISHYWHKPLKKYACNSAHVCPTALLL